MWTLKATQLKPRKRLLWPRNSTLQPTSPWSTVYCFDHRIHAMCVFTVLYLDKCYQIMPHGYVTDTKRTHCTTFITHTLVTLNCSYLMYDWPVWLRVLLRKGGVLQGAWHCSRGLVWWTLDSKEYLETWELTTSKLQWRESITILSSTQGTIINIEHC